MANSVSVSVIGKNGNAYTAAKVTGFPTQGVLIEAYAPTATNPDGTPNPLASALTQLTLLSTSDKYYSATATATVITAANA
tara:strand:- start:22260 stop:22502 length:243 start_codon:yes stop_codon:yes gene_type:complete